MKKSNGFTLTELLAVVILLAILMTIAVPNALKMASRVQRQAYLTKISLIEEAAKNYGESNKNFVMKGTNPKNIDQHYTCAFTFDADNKLSHVNYNLQSGGYNASLSLATNEYWCIRTTIDDLVNNDELDWDKEHACTKCDDTNRAYYDNIVINPEDDYIINKCYVYIYYKNSRIYSAFDEGTCSMKSESVVDGHEYSALK